MYQITSAEAGENGGYNMNESITLVNDLQC